MSTANNTFESFVKRLMKETSHHTVPYNCSLLVDTTLQTIILFEEFVLGNDDCHSSTIPKFLLVRNFEIQHGEHKVILYKVNRNKNDFGEQVWFTQYPNLCDDDKIVERLEVTFTHFINFFKAFA